MRSKHLVYSSRPLQVGPGAEVELTNNLVRTERDNLIELAAPGDNACDSETLAVLDTNFPNSTTYQYTISGGTLGTQTASLTTPSADLFASTVPFFTGTTYDALQGLNPAVPFTFTFNSYTPSAGINTPLTFFGITRVSDGQLVFGTSGDNTLTSVTVPANTLAGNTAYDVGLVFSSRIDTPNAGFGTATSEVAYDLRTDLLFATAVPEPASLALAGAGLASVLATSWYRRRLACGVTTSMSQQLLRKLPVGIERRRVGGGFPSLPFRLGHGSTIPPCERLVSGQFTAALP